MNITGSCKDLKAIICNNAASGVTDACMDHAEEGMKCYTEEDTKKWKDMKF
jgi:hypothetical protein